MSDFLQPRLAAYLSPPPELTVVGKRPQKKLPMLAVVASAKAPASLILHAHDLAQQWRNQPMALISGFQSPIEDEIWQVIFRDCWQIPDVGQVHLIRVLARGMKKRFSAREQHAHAIGRLVTVAPFPDSVKRITKQTAYQRNLVACALADTVLVLHAHEGSETARLAAEVVGWGKRVVTVAHGENEHLLGLGVGVYRE